QVASLATLWPPEARTTGPLPKKPAKHPDVLPATMVLVNRSVAPAAVNVPTKRAAGADAGDTLAVTVEFSSSRTPSVWKAAPPYQAMEVLPLSVLLVMVMLPRLR